MANEVKESRDPAQFPQKSIPWIITIASIVAFVAAVVLTIEKMKLLNDPSYVPSCSINPVLSCGSIMNSDQAKAFGFPNPILGLAGFSLLALFGVRLLLGAQPPRWVWLAAQAGVTFAFGFVCWLIFQSLYRIGALCPYCMVVWICVFTLFWYLTLFNFNSGTLKAPGVLEPVVRVATRFHFVFLTAAVLLVAGLIGEAFWDYWSTLI